MDQSVGFGRTVKLFLTDGTPTGVIAATLANWTGQALVARNATLHHLLKRPEAARTGVYVLYGPDPDDVLRHRAYIGEADLISDRVPDSAKKHGFWETV